MREEITLGVVGMFKGMSKEWFNKCLRSEPVAPLQWIANMNLQPSLIHLLGSRHPHARIPSQLGAIYALDYVVIAPKAVDSSAYRRMVRTHLQPQSWLR